MNVQVDWGSRYVQDSTKWKLNTAIFKKISKTFGQPSINIFVSLQTKKWSFTFPGNETPFARWKMLFNKNGPIYSHMHSQDFA